MGASLVAAVPSLGLRGPLLPAQTARQAPFPSCEAQIAPPVEWVPSPRVALIPAPSAAWVPSPTDLARRRALTALQAKTRRMRAPRAVPAASQVRIQEIG